MSYVTIFIKGVEGHATSILTGDRAVAGRSSKCEITIAHNSVSREHCVFRRREDGIWVVEDSGSSNGTRVNHDRLDGQRVLAENDIVKIGKARLKFHAADAPPVPSDGFGGIRIDKEALGVDGDIAIHHPAPGDPVEAVPCRECGAWVSIAHHLPGDSMDCPRCGRGFCVPSLQPLPTAANASGSVTVPDAGDQSAPGAPAPSVGDPGGSRPS